MHLLGLSEWLAVGAVSDDIVVGKTLCLVQLGRLEHPQANVDDHVGSAPDHHGNQRQAIFGRDHGRWFARAADVLGSVIADQERGYAQCAFLMLWGESERYDRAFSSASGRDGRRRFVRRLADAGPELPLQNQRKGKADVNSELVIKLGAFGAWGVFLIFVHSWAARETLNN